MEFLFLFIFVKNPIKDGQPKPSQGTQKGKVKEKPKDEQPARKEQINKN